MRIRGLSIVIALCLVATAIALRPYKTEATTGPTNVDISNPSSSSSSSGKCDVTAASQINGANDQCPSDASKYDYNCNYPGKDSDGKQCAKGETCSQKLDTGGTLDGTCQCPSICKANGSTQVASLDKSGTGSGATQPPATVPPDTKTASVVTPQQTQSIQPVPSTQTSAPVTQAATQSIPPTAGAQTGSLSNSGIGSGLVQPSNAAPSQSFSGTPNLNNAISPITAVSNPFSSSAGYSNPGSNLNAYTPTTATFNGSSGVSGTQTYNPYNPTITAISPLTNLFSSVGNLNSFFNYVSSVFTPAYVAQPAQTVVSQPTQIVTTISTGQNPQLTKDYFTGASTSQSISWVQQPNSYIDIITGDQQTLSPIDIATIIQGQSGETNPTQALVTQVSANSPIQTLLEQQTPTSLADNSMANLQVPEISSLALNTTNGLENYQNVPEQFYIEEAQLAQAQNDYEWLQAQIEAWENAKDAGVCDNACQNALSILETEVPGQYQQVQQLQGVVNEGPFASTATTSSSTSDTNVTALTATNEVPEVPVGEVQVPGAGQTQVVADDSSTLQTPVPSEGAPYYVKQNDEWCDQYDQCIPASAFQPAPVTQVVASNAEFEDETATSSAPEDPFTLIAQTVQGWINAAVSIFTPNTPASSNSQSCSLFKSLFGGCGSGW